MKLGVFIPFDGMLEERLSDLRSWGIPTCQLSLRREGACTPANADLLRRLSGEYGVEITALWSLQRGPKVWDFHTSPMVIGIVPRAYRWERMTQILVAAELARSIGVKHVALHAGFIPETPSDSNYAEVVAAIGFLATRLADAGQSLLLETGQETPVTLKRTIDDAGARNVGINFDPANFLMYGTANPVDALDLLGPHIMGVHAKDGEYPVDGKALGIEKPIGKGRADFPRLIEKLKAAAYDGPLTIEREIEGPEQKRDIVAAARFLEELL
jgi:L-ribulose-5-phosphate 3-epimerase